MERLSLMVAALGHDIDHPGVNNAFLRNTHHELALRYNDRSVLENHHAAVLFSLLHGDSADLLPANWPEYKQFRALVLDLILSTDMEQHFRMVAELAALSDTVAPGRAEFAAAVAAAAPLAAGGCAACDPSAVAATMGVDPHAPRTSVDAGEPPILRSQQLH